MADYKMIPVDKETYNRIVALCDAYDLGKRAQGLLVRKLVKADYEKLAAVKLVGAKAMGGQTRRSAPMVVEET